MLLTLLGLSAPSADPLPGVAPSAFDASGSAPRAEALEAARRLAVSDRPAARAAVEALVAPDPGDAIDWEARLWLASDRERFQRDPEGALAWTGPLWAAVLSDAVPGDPGARRRLETRTAEVHSRVLAALGRDAASREVEAALKRRDRARTGSPEPAPEPGPRWTPLDRARQARTVRVRQRIGVVSWLGLAIFAGLAGPLALRARRREPRPRPYGALVVALLAGVAGGFGELWEPGAGRAAGWMALGFALVHVVAAFALVGAGERPIRWSVRFLALWATAATGFLALQRTGTLGWVAL